jgi:hypothetical protein
MRRGTLVRVGVLEELEQKILDRVRIGAAEEWLSIRCILAGSRRQLEAGEGSWVSQDVAQDVLSD